MPQTETARAVATNQAATLGSGTSTPVLDLGATKSDTTLWLDLVVSALAGTDSPALTVAVETSSDNVTWRTVKSFAAQVAVGSVLGKVFSPVDRYVRTKWTLTGTTPTATYSVAGVSVRPIVHLGDLTRVQWPRASFVGKSDESVAAALRTAELDASNDLSAARYVMPFVDWDDSLRQDVANIAAWNLLCEVGFNPEGGNDQVVRTRYEDSKKSLRHAHYAQLVDSTPEVDEGEVYVVSEPPRRWR